MELLRTEGEEGIAEVRLGGQVLRALDFASPGRSPLRPGPLPDDWLEIFETVPLTWDAMFAGNPEGRRTLVPSGDDALAYEGYGCIVAIRPTVVDFGVGRFTVDDIRTNDTRCIGEAIHLRIVRLAIWRRTDGQWTRSAV